MSDYLIYRSDQKPFPSIEAQEKLEALGVSNLRQMPEGDDGPVLVGDFHFSGDATAIRLSDDLETFAIVERGKAAIEFAIRLQASYGEPLQIIDIGYAFDLPLKDYQNAAELEHSIQAAYEADNGGDDEDLTSKG